MPDAPFDHHSPLYADTWPDLTTRMREACPVTRTEAWGGYYAVTTYDEVRRVLGDDGTFSSRRQIPGVTEPGCPAGIVIPPSPEESVPIEYDPPENRPYRKLIDPFFSPKASRAWGPFVQRVVTECIDGFIASGRGDFILDIANPVPAILTCAMVGLPTEDWRPYAEPLHAIVYEPPGTPDFERVVEQMQTMLAKVMGTVAERRAEPRDDLITWLTQAVVNGAPLDDDEIRSMLLLLLSGGVDTTTSLMGNAIHWLGRNPEKRDWLRADLSRIPQAREEFLRYFTPTQGLARTTTVASDIAGCAHASGRSGVHVAFAAANRDPCRVLAGRRGTGPVSNRHVAFGLGVHRCIGSHIARIEFDIVLREVLTRCRTTSSTKRTPSWVRHDRHRQRLGDHAHLVHARPAVGRFDAGLQRWTTCRCTWTRAAARGTHCAR
ncbi:cytochrome P450 [Streptomyces sp. KL116D]|uniref:cytochrome P450 n=1 Tax=Streptomyces sp. KL116D TaxID=3045152 RepID=UPI003556BE0E